MIDAGNTVLEHTISKPISGTGAPDYAVGRLLLRHKQVGSWRIELPAGHVFGSLRTFEILDLAYTEDPLSFEDFFACFLTQDRPKAAQLLMQAIADKCGFQFTLNINSKTGAPRLVECFGDVELAANGSARTVVGTIVDVTQRANGERFAYSRSHMLSAMFDTMPAAIAVLDRSMNYVFVSEHWAVGHGVKHASKLTGLNHYEVQKDLMTEEMLKEHKQVLAGATLYRERDLIRDVDGETIPQTCAMTPWYQSKDQVGGMIIMLSKVDTRHQIDPSGEMPTKDEFSQLLDDVA